MRNRPPYRCVRCEAEQLWGARCNRCGRQLLDQDGLPQQAPVPQSDPAADLGRAFGAAAVAGMVATFAALASSMWMTGGRGEGFWLLARPLGIGLGVLVVVYGLGLAWAVRERWRASRQQRSRAEELRRQAGPVVDIATASGESHVRGTVHVIEPTKLERSLGAALVLKRERVPIAQATLEMERDDSGEERERRRVHVVIHELVECGRFAVVDDSGVAVVDEDAFELLALDHRYLGLAGRSVLALKDGDTVEIIGPARRAAAPEDVQSLVSSSGYRGVPEVLLFDGTPEERVRIIVSGGAGAT